MRPRFTVAIPAYNCAHYLGETLRSVLAQDYPADQLQLVVVDDGSTDHPESVVQALAPGRIELHRQANQGPCKTFNACVGFARGELVHLLHGDDKVLPGFYRHVDAVYRGHPEVGMFTCRSREIDARGAFLRDSYLPPPTTAGLVSNYERLIVPRNHIRTPGVVLRRDVYEKMGGYDPRLNHTQDWHMWLKASVWGPVWHEVAALTEYRMHEESDTSRKVLSGVYLVEIWQAVAFWTATVPPVIGLPALSIMDRAVVRLAVNDLAARKFDPVRRETLLNLFADQLPHLAVPLRQAIARRLGFLNLPSEPAGKRRVVIFGAGEAGKKAAAGLDPARNEIIAFLDNNRGRHGELVLGHPVIEPSRVRHLEYDYILLASMAHEEMHQQLRHLGLDMRDVAAWKTTP